MTEQTPEPENIEADPSASVAADTEIAEDVTPDPSDAPLQDDTVDAPQSDDAAEGTPAPGSLDPQETVVLVLEEDGSNGAYIFGHYLIAPSGTDVLAGDAEQIIACAKADGRKINVQ